jgi:hypothetical protein
MTVQLEKLPSMHGVQTYLLFCCVQKYAKSPCGILYSVGVNKIRGEKTPYDFGGLAPTFRRSLLPTFNSRVQIIF